MGHGRDPAEQPEQTEEEAAAEAPQPGVDRQPHWLAGDLADANAADRAGLAAQPDWLQTATAEHRGHARHAWRRRKGRG